MIAFILGLVLGLALTAGLFAYLVWRFEEAATDVKAAHTDLRLMKARQRFGQIATRESIREVRKIAQQAIKELS